MVGLHHSSKTNLFMLTWIVEGFFYYGARLLLLRALVCSDTPFFFYDFEFVLSGGRGLRIKGQMPRLQRCWALRHVDKIHSATLTSGILTVVVSSETGKPRHGTMVPASIPACIPNGAGTMLDGYLCLDPPPCHHSKSTAQKLTTDWAYIGYRAQF